MVLAQRPAPDTPLISGKVIPFAGASAGLYGALRRSPGRFWHGARPESRCHHGARPGATRHRRGGHGTSSGSPHPPMPHALVPSDGVAAPARFIRSVVRPHPAGPPAVNPADAELAEAH